MNKCFFDEVDYMEEKEFPLVSVIMSTYNDEKYIQESIQSILSQSYKNIELIIVNDASTDTTKTILENIEDDRVTIITNSVNKKLASNLNFALSISKGKYIARMDADDISATNRIATQVEYMENNTDIDVVGSFAERIGAASGIVVYPTSHEEIKDKLLFDNCMCHPSIMFRASTLDYAYDINFPAGQDYELWSRIIWKKKFANIPEALLKYRIHENQTRNTNGKQQKAGAVAARIRMIGHLLEPDKAIETYVHTAFDYSLPKSVEELEQIENVLKQIIDKNTYKHVYTSSINQYANEQFYDDWYISVGCNGVGLDLIRKSDFNKQYFNNGLLGFLKIIRRMLYNRRRMRFAGK